MDAQDHDPRAGAPSGHLLANLRELMGAWFSERERGGATTRVEREISEAAARQGLSLGFNKMALADVPEDGFPVVMLERSGASRLILHRIDASRYRVQGQSGPVEMRAAELAQLESGTVFFARALPRTIAPEQAERSDGEQESPRELASPPASAAARPPFRLMQSRTVRDLVAAMVIGNGRLLAALAATGLIGNLLFVALPVFSMAVYDRVVPHNAGETMVALSIGVVLALITDFGIRAVRAKLSDALSLQAQVDMTARVLQQLLRVRLSDAPRDPAPLLLALRDLEILCQILPTLFISLSIDLIFVLAICLFLTVLGGLVGLVPLIGFVMLALSYAVSHFLAEREGEKNQKLQRTQSSLVIDSVAALETIKAHHAEYEIEKRFKELADQVAYSGHRERHFGTLAQQGAITISQMMTVIAMVFSVMAIGAGAMTVGAMSAATMIVSRVMPPLSQLIGFFHRIWQLRRGIERIDYLMAHKPETAGDGHGSRRAIEGALEMHHVSLAYPGAARKALERINLSIKAGEKIGIVGRIGCGKTSLMRVLARLAEPSEGAVSLDGFDLMQFDPQALRRAVSFLRQDARLFGGSPLAHMSLGLGTPDPDVLTQALAVSGAGDFIKRHPKGLQMPVGGDGHALSGGERQAVALARLIAGNPRVVLLDEPTAAMDNALEAHVIQSLRSWLGDRTLILSTHRVPLLSLVDRVIVMDQGRVIADGPRDEILKRLSQPAA